MAQIQLTNLTSNALPLGDLGSKSLAGNETITITRPANALPQMASVIAAVAAGTLSVTVTPTAAELASGFLSPPQSVQAEDLAPVAATDAAAVCGKWRLPMTAGTPGTADPSKAEPLYAGLVDATPEVSEGSPRGWSLDAPMGDAGGEV